MLLAEEKIGDNRWHLYAIEIVYQKILRIIKNESAEELSLNWRIGYVTSVSTVSVTSLEDNSFTTDGDRLGEKYPEFVGLLLNKASTPERVLSSSVGTSYGIIRLRQMTILDEGTKIDSMIWGLTSSYGFIISDPWWLNYWSNNYSKENAERYRKYLSKSRRKVFALIENKASELNIKKLMVL